MTERIDAHHHFWRYSAEEYGWIDDRMKTLRREFLLPDLEEETRATRIDGVVTVQVRQSMKETDWLLGIAGKSATIRGVVGWAPIADADFERQLEGLRAQKKLRGLRHLIQGEPDDRFILGAAFNRGIALLHKAGLVYDILIYERHLPHAIEFVDRHPNQVFVLDHMAKPRIAEGLLEPWRENLMELGRREHVYCKVSGMVTEADWSAWSSEGLRPYWETVLEAFGPRRLMFGSDWPVCLVASSYGQWVETVREWASALSHEEQTRIFGETAIEAYGLA